jgi:hypothetical protein
MATTQTVKANRNEDRLGIVKVAVNGDDASGNNYIQISVDVSLIEIGNNFVKTAAQMGSLHETYYLKKDDGVHVHAIITSGYNQFEEADKFERGTKIDLYDIKNEYVTRDFDCICTLVLEKIHIINCIVVNKINKAYFTL